MRRVIKINLLNFAEEEFSMDLLEDNNNLFEDNESLNDKADEDIDPSKIFDDDNPQGIVGEDDDEENDDGVGRTYSKEKEIKGSSPKAQFYSSALKALKDDSVLPDIDDEFIKDATTPEKFAEAIEKQVEARLDHVQKRINEALTVGVNVDDVKRYESIISNLDSITDDALEGESEDSEQLRRNIIYQDLINRGFKKERALKEVEKSFNAGTDIEDAKLALDGNKEYFTDSYNSIIESKREEESKRKIAEKESLEALKKKILGGNSSIGISIDKSSAYKIYENISKPIHKGADGKLLTELQKYSEENPGDAQYFFSLFYTMTDGFKNIDKLVGAKVRQESKKSIKELEHKLRNTPMSGDGSIDFTFGADDSESFIGKNFTLNI